MTYINEATRLSNDKRAVFLQLNAKAWKREQAGKKQNAALSRKKLRSRGESRGG